MITEVTAKVGSPAVEVYFVDSGPVSGSVDYITLVIWHGAAFNGNIFRKLLPLAGDYNLRIIIPNRREYFGSNTRYTDAEMEDLAAGRSVFLKRLGLQVADFLIYLTTTYDIPKSATDRKSGGIVIVPWSIGNATHLALLGHPDFIPKERYIQLEPYLKDFIMYDPPHFSFGYPIPSDVEIYEPWTDPDCTTPEELVHNFRYWVSSYFDHPGLVSGSFSGLDFRKRGERSSITNMTQEDIVTGYDETAAARTDLPMFSSAMQANVADQAQRALRDENFAASILPALRLIHIGCTRSNWHCAWGYIESERIYKEHVSQGRKIRPVRFVEIEANHFLHWDDPKAFLDVITDVIRT